jgi:signal transduction histidine kinase
MHATSRQLRTATRPVRTGAVERRKWLSVSGAAIALIGVRWGAWIIAAFYVLSGSHYRPDVPVYTEKEPLLLIIAFLQTVALTAFALLVRPRLAENRRGAEVTPDPLLISGLLDFALAMALVYLSGGWGSPFYHFAITALIVPAFLVRPAWATILTAVFVVSYVLVLRSAGFGTAGDWDDVGRANLFGHIVTGALVVAAVQFLASVTRQLEQERDERQALAAQEERARIAREIHDGIAQSVYMLSLNLETTAEKAESGSQTGETVRDLVPLSKQILMEVRHYIFDLKPLLQGDQSLREALLNQTREFASVTGISVDLNVGQPARPLSPDAAITIYRTVQEALANAYRHGAASRVSVDLTYNRDEAELTVEDDGSGFDVHEAAGGNGLRNMEERATALGGFVEVQSAPGQGTRLRMVVPADA